MWVWSVFCIVAKMQHLLYFGIYFLCLSIHHSSGTEGEWFAWLYFIKYQIYNWFLSIVYDFWRITFHNNLGYQKQESKYCANHYGNYSKFSNAIKACDADVDCSAVYSGWCDISNFYLCRSPLHGYSSSIGSCLYAKTGKVHGI